jgi:hypothetical protein
MVIRKGQKMRVFVLVALLVASGAAFASSGGLDRNGCHTSKGDGFHCHKQKIEKIKQHYGAETQSERSKRLKAQCQGLENKGICFGYSDGQPVKYGQ